MDMHTRNVDALGVAWKLTLSSSISDDEILRHGMPGDLPAATDVVIDMPDRDARFTINGIPYAGTLYLRSRSYVVSDLNGGNRWDARTHYLDTQFVRREGSWAMGGLTDAAAKTLAKSELIDAARELLADPVAVRAYWGRHWNSSAGYRIDDAKRAIETANRYASLARTYGANTPDRAVVEVTA